MGKNWLVTSNTSRTKLVTFHHRRSDPELPPVTMNGCHLEVALYLERILGLNLTPDFKWNTYDPSLKLKAFTASASCDMKNRFPGTCPPNHCCAMAGFPAIGVFCRPLPRVGEKCATRNIPFICPCAPGLTCQVKVRPDGSKSMYGKCA